MYGTAAGYLTSQRSNGKFCVAQREVMGVHRPQALTLAFNDTNGLAITC